MEARRAVRILVATEDSLPTLPAIRFGARLAAATGGELVVLAIGNRFPHALAEGGGLALRLASALNEAARVSSANALEQARREAARLGARIRCESLRPRRVESIAETISRIADRERADLSLMGRRLVKALGFVPELRRADFRAARAILDSTAREARRLGARVTLRYFVPRRPVFAEHAVTSEAARQRADLIVVGNSGRSSLGDAFLGSVAQRVVSLARPPVVLVRARRR